MVTRYEGESGEVDLELVDYIPTDNSSNDPIHSKLSTLLQWHAEDPVDDWERNRNDIIYYDYQNNRNPFIDYPEWVDEIWGSDIGLNDHSAYKSTELIKVVDFLGRECAIESGVPQLYVYSDGSVVKRVVAKI
jgi:hypothetical protein